MKLSLARARTGVWQQIPVMSTLSITIDSHAAGLTSSHYIVREELSSLCVSRLQPSQRANGTKIHCHHGAA